MATWTQSDIDALKTALKGGVLKVKYKDREVTYQDLRSMRELLASMQEDVNAQNGVTNHSFITTRKGFRGDGRFRRHDDCD